MNTASKHNAIPFDVQPRRGRFAVNSSETSLDARLKALGFVENVAFREPMAGLGAWRAEVSGRVSLDFSRRGMAPASDELRRALDEGELDEILLRGGPRPACSGSPRVEVDADKLSELAGALAGRFAAVQDVLVDTTSVTLTLESPQLAAQLQEGCEVLGLRFDKSANAIRLHTEYAGRLKTVELAFDVVRRVLKLLEAGRPVSVDAAPATHHVKSDSHVRSATADEVDVLLPKLLALEAKIFEPARRDPAEKLRLAFDEADGIASVAEVLRDGEWVLAGFSLAIPLEMVHADGPDQDVFRGACNTLYAVSTTLDPDMHGRGLGLGLKKEVIRAARMLNNADGTPRYRFLSGRNRTGATGAMQRVNQRLGGYTVATYGGQYGGDGEAIYYRMPIGPIARLPEGDTSGVPKSWLRALSEGRYIGALLRPQAMNTGMLPETVDALEHMAQRVPGRTSVAVFGSIEGALRHVGDGAYCVLGDSDVSARQASGFDDVREDEVLIWRASHGAVFVFGAGALLGDADEFEVLRAWHTSRAGFAG